MGLAGISPGSLLVVLLLALILFGSKKIKTIGQDLGEAIKAFKKAIDDKS